MTAAARLAVIDDGKANALSFEVIDMLRAEIRAATDDGTPLVIVGRPGYFSAGFDLSVMRGDDKDRRAALLQGGADLFRDMVTAPVPVVAACTGHALAAGALVLLSVDYRIGGRQPCKIGLNEVSIGMPLPLFAIALARHRIATQHLTSATALADVGPAERAVEIGYLDVLADDAVEAAMARAEELAALASKPFAVTKQRLRAPLVAEIDSFS